jgi:hypothetical protein
MPAVEEIVWVLICRVLEAIVSLSIQKVLGLQRGGHMAVEHIVIYREAKKERKSDSLYK